MGGTLHPNTRGWVLLPSASFLFARWWWFSCGTLSLCVKVLGQMCTSGFKLFFRGEGREQRADGGRRMAGEADVTWFVAFAVAAGMSLPPRLCIALVPKAAKQVCP